MGMKMKEVERERRERKREGEIVAGGRGESNLDESSVVL